MLQNIARQIAAMYSQISNKQNKKQTPQKQKKIQNKTKQTKKNIQNKTIQQKQESEINFNLSNMLDSIDFSSKADEHLTVKITPIKNTCPLLCEHNDFSICKGVFQPTDFGLNDVPIIQQMQKATEECKLYDQALQYHDWSINDDSSFKITQSTNRHLNGQPNHLSFCSIAQYNYAKKKNKKNKSKPSNVEVRNERKIQKEITQTRQKERQVKLQNSLDANNVRDILLTSLFPSSAKRAMVLFKLEQTAPEHLQPRLRTHG